MKYIRIFKSTLIFCILLYSSQLLAQNQQIDKIEQEIRSGAIGGEFEKLSIDLNNDNIPDIIYLYQAAEPKAIEVYLNMDGTYKRMLKEMCSSYSLWQVGDVKKLQLTLYTCCGESPYISKRMFSFKQSQAQLLENYVITNRDYVANAYLLVPEIYLPDTYYVRTTTENYNMRFLPSIDKFREADSETFSYGCEDGTNIIAKIKIGSQLKVLAELIEKDRTWLFVEMEESAIAEGCNPLNFDFDNQKLRGWVSGKFVKKE